MEASPLPTSSPESWAEQFTESLNLQRDRVREFLAGQQERIKRAEAELTGQLQQVAHELAKKRAHTHQTGDEIQQRSEQLARETETLQALKEELAARQAEWEKLRQQAIRQQEALAEQFQRQQDELDRRLEELTGRQTEIDEAGARLHHDRQALELARGEHRAELEQFAAQQERLDSRQAELDAQRQQLAASQADTESQRRRIAREFKAQRAAHLKELERRRTELERGDAAQQSELKWQLETAQKHEEGLAAELESLRGKCDQLELELAQQSDASEVDAGKLQNLQAERNALLERLAETEGRLSEAERRLAEVPKGGAGGEPPGEDVQRRYDMAMEDIRELKQQNAELQQRLAQAPSATGQAPAPEGGTLDWEAEKKRILASLESDFQEDDEQAKAERLKIEELTQRTDWVLAEKDREIDELKQLLENQSTSVGSVAVGAAALGEMLDSDAFIQEERENLKRMQQEWREKLRKAEIDISVERAKIARERAEIEEKLRALEERSSLADAETGESGKSGKPVRGRWLARLGLKNLDEE